MLPPRKKPPLKTGNSSEAPRSEECEHPDKKESKVPSITNTEGSSEEDAMPELGPYCSQLTKAVNTSFDTGYDSLSKFEKITRTEGSNQEPLNQNLTNNGIVGNKKNSAAHKSNFDQNTVPTSFSHRKGKSISSNHSKADAFSISTDVEFPPPVRSHIPSDEASCISAITFDSTNIEATQTNVRPFLQTKNIYCVPPTGKSNDGEYNRKEVIDNYRNEYCTQAAEGTRRKDKLDKCQGKVLDLQKQSLKETNMKLMIKLSGCHRDSSKSLLALSENLDSKTTDPEPSKVVSTTTTEYSSNGHEDDHESLRSLDLIFQLEQQNCQMFSQLREAELLHSENMKKISDLEEIRSEQKARIEALENQLKGSNQSIMKLENHLETMIEELVLLRQHQEEEKGELQKAYDKLQSETNLTIELLQSRLMECQNEH